MSVQNPVNKTGDIFSKRKVYLVPLIQPSPQAPEGFAERFKAYWEAVDKQVSGLEVKAGIVMRIFVEGVVGRGDDASLMLERANPEAYRIVKPRLDAGAVFDDFEDQELFGELVDWGRCLTLPFISQKVAETVSQSYTNVADKRRLHLETRISDGILDSEAVLLLSGASDIKFPDDVERFVVAPPELDQLERWVRAANDAIRKEAENKTEREVQENEKKPESPTESGLWTPN